MKKILVIEDDEGVLEAFKVMLEFEGYDVEVLVKNGQDIKDRIKTSKPDLLILDMLLSGSDGRDITKDLRQDKKTKDIPIIMVSAHPDTEDSALKAGASDFLAKPFDMQELFKKIEKYT
ncbi:MAG: Response regulator receiver [Candidatus Daviesbacteria bacterium GW2011_GWA2_38_24]|uniref:Response regulator receiver n=1 Tax=Candidatus Daviesbacteria bacterium GW2011_GWA2_38_24 TaxID=1618422 RepID=A0A0G0JGU6_9BACT|nr:MAG: Response regulator receiver [Candidatus Daviesbacteria bacterium GW2011_GWA2_38_24]KKQ80847.1 MAG: Response regulator receiver [Candidatus Daviesbacteria bacterium GW2011_GWA1_38_7]